MTLVSSSARPIDERLLAYFERSDLFGPASVVEKQPDEGRRLVVDVPVEAQHFLFGTDTNGRDLLTRTMMAGQVSLAIGLLADLRRRSSSASSTARPPAISADASIS